MPDVFTTKKKKRQSKPAVLPVQENQAESNTSQTPNETVAQTNEPPSPPSPSEHHLHMLASFCQDPVGFTFQTQEADETILLFLRRHFITNIPWIFTTILLALVPFVFGIFFPMLPFFSLIPSRYIFILELFYLLIVFAYAFIGFITWFYNVSIVTQKRIIDIDFSDVVYKNVAETKLDLVQDVDYTQIGVIQSIFNFGDVIVHTAGDNPHFDFLEVPRPADVTRIIENLIGRSPRVP